MKKFFKIAGIIVGVFILVVLAGIIYLNSAYPKVDPPSTEKVDITPARLERGKYLANHVSVCIDCHSTRDWSKFSGPVIPGTEGKGGDVFDKETAGIPGAIYARNITPYSLKNWSDGELMRTITNGVTKDNVALFPLMPYLAYNHLSKEDLFSLVAYLRSLEPIENNIPERSLDFPMSMIVKTIPPKSYNPSETPDTSDMEAYGKYLVSIAACYDCHTPKDKGEPLPGMEYAGGFEFKTPLGTIRSVNITPDEETGIGKWTMEDFVKKFKSMATDSGKKIPVKMGEFNTIMPWIMYGGMTEHDLTAIYTYLRTVTPVHNRVNRFTPPSNKKE